MKDIRIEDVGDIDVVIVHGNVERVFHEDFSNVARVIIKEKK